MVTNDPVPAIGTFLSRWKVILAQEEWAEVWRPFTQIVSMDLLLMNQVDGIPEKKKIQEVVSDLCMQVVDG